MAQKRENVFIKRVHRHLPKSIVPEKTNNPYRAGPADVIYYAPEARLLLVEYKWMPSVPSELCVPRISTFTRLQQEWLKARHAQGFNVALIIGCPGGGLVYPGVSWEAVIEPAIVPFEDVVAWIIQQLS